MPFAKLGGVIKMAQVHCDGRLKGGFPFQNTPYDCLKLIGGAAKRAAFGILVNELDNRNYVRAFNQVINI